MKQPPDGLPISSPGISSRLSSPLASGGVATNSYHRTGLRRIEKPAAPPEKSLEFSAGLKTLDFPAEQQLYEHALDAAIELLQADAGVLATLEPDGTRLVVRAQRAGSLLGAHYHALAALGRSADSSLPPTPLRAEAQPLEFQKTQPLPMLPQPSDPDEAEIASKNGEAAPATPAAPPAGYARGQGLLGHIWETNRALALSGEKCRALPRDEMTPPDQEAAWHIAAPLRMPQALLPLPTDEPAPVVGVITVSVHDKHWSPTKRHAEILQFHADQIALALQMAWLEETRFRQARFLRLLHDASLHFSTTLDQERLFAELHQLAAAILGETSFAVLLYHQDKKEEVEFAYIAEYEGAPRRSLVKESKMPLWWPKIKNGAIFTISTPEERQEYTDLLRTGWLGGPPFESMLIMPLFTRTREHIVGALGVASAQPRVYTHDQVELLETIAQTAAFAFENADLYDRSTKSQEQAKSRKRQVAALNNAVSTLNASLHLDEILQNLVQQVNLLTAAQVCTVFLFEEESQTMVARASNATREHFRAWGITDLQEIRLALPDDMYQPLKSGAHTLLDKLDEERASPTPLGELYRQYDIHSILLMPIARQESLLGVLSVYTPGERHKFESDEIILLRGLAGQAAVALHNANLFMDLERALEQQKELDRLKDDFIVTASHEFRTPLSAIHGYASLLQRHSAKLTAEQASRFSTEITRAAQQLVGMVTTLMDASRLDSRKLSLSPQTVEVRPLAESALALIQPDIQQPIHTDIPAGLWVHADQERLRQVMTNLLTNAGKYSPSSSPIDFLARIERQFTPPEAALATKTASNQSGKSAAPGGLSPETAGVSSAGYVVFSVIDRGEGISLDDQKKLFQKFVRLQRSLTTPVRGTGLGLYICRQYLTAMGGYIWVESTPGQGSTFSFALPLMPSPPAAAGKSASSWRG
ncbi:MAG TPA: GAF domain-containing sensor histidine kinase [Ktedonobacterales bacterium]|nr:GAF domain-containing sensor histidine kinase [Ktedonobacterales bacterium]